MSLPNMAPSILPADFLKLHEQVQAAERGEQAPDDADRTEQIVTKPKDWTSGKKKVSPTRDPCVRTVYCHLFRIREIPCLQRNYLVEEGDCNGPRDPSLTGTLCKL
jgi:hypothetical protein